MVFQVAVLERKRIFIHLICSIEDIYFINALINKSNNLELFVTVSIESKIITFLFQHLIQRN